MAFFRERFSKLTQKWTVSSVSISQYNSKRLAKDIEKEGPVSYTDIMAVLTALPTVMRRYLAEGHTVKLDGIGTFFLAVQCTKTGVANKEDISAEKITNVKVQFRPEVEASGRKGKRHNTLVEDPMEWHYLAAEPKKPTDDSEAGETPVETANVVITANVNDPTMGTVTGGGTYVQGASVTLTATANTGYHFVQWSNGRTTASITVTAEADATLTATFAADNPGGNGGDNGMDG